jgi:hypothetical protein
MTLQIKFPLIVAGAVIIVMALWIYSPLVLFALGCVVGWIVRGFRQ